MTLSYIPSDTNDEGVLKATASGTLPSGQAVVVNADGTVSVITGASQAVGTAVVFESAGATWTSTVFDSNSNKIVIVYSDAANSRYGTAVVGNVSGTSITFGTPVVFESGRSDYLSATFDNNSNKVVISYNDYSNSQYATAIVGTVSGTSISFGTPVVFKAVASYLFSSTFDSNLNKVVIAYFSSSIVNVIVGTVSGTSISFGSNVTFSANSQNISCTFDSNSNKIVVSYGDYSNGYYGTAVVGTISGTSISFGTAAVFVSGQMNGTSLSFDSNNNKIVAMCSNNGNGNFGTAAVGTVSGTSISFGTPVVFESAAIAFVEPQTNTYDENTGKVVFSYADQGNGEKGTFISGTVSGTSISFDTAEVFENASTDEISSGYDSNAQKIVIAYKDKGNSNFGTAIAVQPGFTTLTAENYIGISTGGTYASGSTATVKIIGNTSNEQSSLTAGQAYYVQTDGTLGLTAADPSVFAGTAISATKLLVKT